MPSRQGSSASRAKQRAAPSVARRENTTGGRGSQPESAGDGYRPGGGAENGYRRGGGGLCGNDERGANGDGGKGENGAKGAAGGAGGGGGGVRCFVRVN